MRPSFSTLTAILLLVLVPGAASAVTREEVVRLSKSGVSDAIILGLIDRDKTIFAIDSDELVALRDAGVSEAVILAMLKSGRAEGEAAVRQQAAQRAAEIAEQAWLPPNVVVVGHGPDRPNTAYRDRFSRPRAPNILPGAIYPTPPAAAVLPVPRALCLARVMPGPSRASLAYVTECPPVLQPRLGQFAR